MSADTDSTFLLSGVSHTYCQDGSRTSVTHQFEIDQVDTSKDTLGTIAICRTLQRDIYQLKGDYRNTDSNEKRR